MLSDLPSLVADAMKRLMRHRERYLKAWIAATGVHPEDAELVEDHRYTPDGLEIIISIRRRDAPRF